MQGQEGHREARRISLLWSTRAEHPLCDTLTLQIFFL